MRRLCLIGSLACATLAGACRTSPVYVPGPHAAPMLRRAGDTYFSGAVDEWDTGSFTAARAFTDRFVVSVAGRSSVRERTRARGTTIRQSGADITVGWLSTSKEHWLEHTLLTFSHGDAESVMGAGIELFEEDAASFRAAGRYDRIALQRLALRTGALVDYGGSVRFSAVRFSKYRRFAMTASCTYQCAYDRDTTFTGSLIGAFAEPALLVQVGYKGFKIGPQVSGVIGLGRTAFGHIPLSAALVLSTTSSWGRRPPDAPTPP